MSGQQLRLRGMRLAASKHADSLVRAQVAAKCMAFGDTALTIEDVRAGMEAVGLKWDLGNAAGSVFSGEDWQPCGVTTAKRPEAHGRLLRTWRLKHGTV
jgi:hypothetical protein